MLFLCLRVNHQVGLHPEDLLRVELHEHLHGAVVLHLGGRGQWGQRQRGSGEMRRYGAAAIGRCRTYKG